MRSADLISLAVGAVRAHRVRTTLAVSGTAVGVASVILLISLGEGARAYVSNQFMSLGSNLVIVIPGKTETTGGLPLIGGTTRELTIDDAFAIRRSSLKARWVAPVSLGQASARYAGKGRSITVIGATRDYFEMRDMDVATGQTLPDTDPRRGARVAVIGRTVQRELFSGSNPLGRTLRIGEWRFRVIGVLERKGTALGMDMDDVVIVPVQTAMKLFNRDGLYRILIEAGAFQEMENTKEEVKRILTARHGEQDFTIFTEGALVSAFGDILSALTLALGGIAAVSLSVAGIGVMNVMLVSVSERTSEIGLWKALGAKRAQILLAFISEAVLISGMGASAGVILGLLGNWILHWQIPALPPITPAWAILSAIGVAMGVGVIFGVLPARRAAAIPAVDALRKGR